MNARLNPPLISAFFFWFLMLQFGLIVILIFRDGNKDE